MTRKWLDNEIIKVLDKLGKKICRQFNYEYNEIKRLHPNDGWYSICVGYCHIPTREIRIKLKNSKGFYKIEYLIDTLIHEIAHLEDDPNGDEEHPNDWKKRYKEMKKWIKKNIY